ncbi:hypothetical protein QE320_gp061 [Pseudomonas phage EM]|uniref:Uncharacterized protein n=1 Tax=Pseudomonas phage EM TaxID=2936914 RepID=A0AAE9HIV5_9CAUD|nr:hypothetical protein QE320_gp002 [Pseudomonas phage EM]YP_010761780.1 hypothetical protein QE320_gp061 [Pseudomonas phage EM]UPW35804.1 hypothetical protein EM_002 [Pseudomonas phage EM]UPW35993.1 hypothetical protein EM_208 [Pseudomonas phage EM]
MAQELHKHDRGAHSKAELSTVWLYLYYIATQNIDIEIIDLRPANTLQYKV